MSLWTNSCWVTVQMKATEYYFPAVTFESVDEMLRYDHSNESYKEFFPVVLFIKIYKVVRIFESVDEIIVLNEMLNF